MTIFSDLLENETITSVRGRMTGYAQAAGLAITSWIVGDPAEQMLATFGTALYTARQTISQATRGFASLDTSTDPGDEDPYDADNVDLPAEAGFLSEHGKNVHDTERREATFATGFVTFDNSASALARTFSAESLTFTWTGGTPPSPAPTYRNSYDASIYTDAGRNVTVAARASLVIPIEAEEVGTRSNAGTGEITLTTSIVNATATNASPVLGTDRESATDYRERCRTASARLSLGGPDAAYEYLAKTNVDGTPLLNASEVAVNITRVQVSQESATGIVDAYFASPSGAAIAADVTAANANIEEQAFAVPDAITYTGAAATEVPITVSGTASLKSLPGVSSELARQAIVDALTAEFSAYDIGGKDQVAGAGVVYTEDIQAVAACSYAGLYNLQITAPSAATTALAKGEVATLTTATGNWTVTLVP